MYINEDINKELYNQLMLALKKQNMEYTNYTFNSLDMRLKQIINEIKGGRFRYLVSSMIRYMDKNIEKKISLETESNYFSDDKIAIYSCITGGYDTMREPVFKPDNCDFYMVTDQKIDNKNSIWNVIDIDKYVPSKNMSAKDKNRYVKMHPEKIFKDYRYSIYIDGNIQVVTDFTEFIQNMPSCGIATFKHPRNDCVFQEAKSCIITKKVNKKEIEEHLKYLKEMNMPFHYGLAGCGFIVREHHNSKCIKMMNDWWDEYKAHSKRDQISFAYISYKNNEKMEDITILGENLYKNYAIRILPHYLNR